jgi:hypothetical protein
MFVRSRSIRPRMSENPSRTGLCLATLVVLAAVALLCSSPAPAHENPARPTLSLLGDSLNLKLEDGKDTIPVGVTVRNSSDRKVDLEFTAEMRDSEGDPHTIKIPSNKSIEAHSVAQVDLDISRDQLESLPLEGFLVASDARKKVEEKVTPGTLPITISESDPRPAMFAREYDVPLVGLVDTRNLLLFVPFVFSLAVVGAGCVWFYISWSKRSDSEKQLGYLKRVRQRWDFAPLIGQKSAFGTGLAFDPSKSWATIITGIVTLSAAFVGAQVFPEIRPTLTQKDTLVLSLFFGAVIFVAPATYNVLRWRRPFVPKKRSQDGKQDPAPQQAQAPKLDKEPEFKGYALPLALASAGILGALLGQLALVILLINEIDNAFITDTGRLVHWFLAAAAVVYAIVYVARGYFSCLQEQAMWRESLEREKNELLEKTTDGRQQIDGLTQKEQNLRRQITELENKVGRTAEEEKELRERRRKSMAIAEELRKKGQEVEQWEERLEEIPKERDDGTYRSQLRAL